MNINGTETDFKRVKDIEISDALRTRIITGNDRIDSLFGGGLIPGSCISICGVGGSGKTTLLLQILSLIDSQGKRTAYATGEQSSEQVASACERLGIDNIDLAHIKTVETIADSMKRYDILVVDSFQSLKKPKGMKVGEFRQYAQDSLINKAKETGCILIFVLHITTAGLPKGGTDIIHAVDVNIKMTVDGDNRIIDVYKNRGGSTNKHNFIMTDKGFDLGSVKDKPKLNGIPWLTLIGDILTKSSNKKLKYAGQCVSSIDRIMKKIG